MKPNPNERLEENLRRLNLLRILEIYPEILRRENPPKSGLLAVLDRLFEEEARARFERIVLRRLKEARIPVPKTLDGFDFNHPKKIDRAKVLRLFDLDFVLRSATCASSRDRASARRTWLRPSATPPATRATGSSSPPPSTS